jgi:hypothetical protein
MLPATVPLAVLLPLTVHVSSVAVLQAALLL